MKIVKLIGAISLVIFLIGLLATFYYYNDKNQESKTSAEDRFLKDISESMINVEEFKDKIQMTYQKTGTLEPYTYKTDFFKDTGNTTHIYSRNGDTEITEINDVDKAILVLRRNEMGYVKKNDKLPIVVSNEFIEQNNLIDTQNAEEMYRIFSSEEFLGNLIVQGETESENNMIVLKYANYDMTTYFMFDVDTYKLEEMQVFNQSREVIAMTQIKYELYDTDVANLQRGSFLEDSEAYKYLVN